MKRLIAITLSLIIVLSCSTISSFAYNGNFNNFAQNTRPETTSSKAFTVLTKHSSGEITSEIKNFSENSISRIISDNPNVLDAYIPEDSAYQYSTTTVASTTDSDGRSSIFDSRTGLIVSGFDTDDDGVIEEWIYGTGSLQHYDIVISCAHILWNPLYKNLDIDGWASEIYFLGGVNGNKYAPLAYSSYESISISQAYVDNSYVAPAPGGTYTVVADLNYDWSIIQVADKIGNQLGWYGLHGCGTPETGVSIYTVGYPYDKGNTQWSSTGKLLSFSDNIVYHNAVTTYGDSGAPMINNECVYAMVTGQVGSQYTGIRIFDELFGMIVDSRNESEERWG